MPLGCHCTLRRGTSGWSLPRLLPTGGTCARYLLKSEAGHSMTAIACSGAHHIGTGAGQQDRRRAPVADAIARGTPPRDNRHLMGCSSGTSRLVADVRLPPSLTRSGHCRPSTGRHGGGLFQTALGLVLKAPEGSHETAISSK